MGKRILIAEDDEGILDAMKIMLEMEGYEVKTTVDGDALHNMEEELPDLLILDIWMAGMDGRTICRYLKSQDAQSTFPLFSCLPARRQKRPRMMLEPTLF